MPFAYHVKWAVFPSAFLDIDGNTLPRLSHRTTKNDLLHITSIKLTNVPITQHAQSSDFTDLILLFRLSTIVQWGLTLAIPSSLCCLTSVKCTQSEKRYVGVEARKCRLSAKWCWKTNWENGGVIILWTLLEVAFKCRRLIKTCGEGLWSDCRAVYNTECEWYKLNVRASAVEASFRGGGVTLRLDMPRLMYTFREGSWNEGAPSERCKLSQNLSFSRCSTTTTRVSPSIQDCRPDSTSPYPQFLTLYRTVWEGRCQQSEMLATSLVKATGKWQTAFANE